MTDFQSLKDFYKSRDKLLEKNETVLTSLLFDYDDDGNLVEKNKEGSVVKTIPLPNYRPLSFEEFDEIDKKRDEAIAIATKQFEDARNELYQEYQNPDRMESTLLRLNRKIMEADEQLQFSRFPLRYVSNEEGIIIRTLDFKQPNEIRKYPYTVAFLQTNPYTLQDQYVRLGEAPPKPLLSVNEIKEKVLQDIPVILFEKSDTNEYGFLSLDWAVQIQFNAMNYHSVKQALAVELAKQFNDQTHLDEILLTESPDEISYSLKDVPGDKDENEAKWNEYTKKLLYDINIVKFTQYPELGNRLLETRNAILGAYVVDDTLIGIGISLDRMEAKNPINWTGQNHLGKVLMDIRQYLKNKQQEVESKPVSVKRKKPFTKSIEPSSSSSSSTTTSNTLVIPTVATLPIGTPSVQSNIVPTVASLPIGTPSVQSTMVATMPVGTPSVQSNIVPTVASLPVGTPSVQSNMVPALPVGIPSVQSNMVPAMPVGMSNVSSMMSVPASAIASTDGPKKVRRRPVPNPVVP